MDVSEYLEMFIEESKEYLQSLNVSLLGLENTPDDKALINEIFRVAHTLKGMAATMGFTKMSTLTHNMENVLSSIRDGSMDSSAELLDILFQCLDALEGYITHISEVGNEGSEENSSIIKSLSLILSRQTETRVQTEQKDTKEAIWQRTEQEKLLNDEAIESKHLVLTLNDYDRHAITQATVEGYKTFGITVVFIENCVLKSARAFIVFRVLDRLGEMIKSYPTVQEIEDEKFDRDFSVITISKESKESFIKALNAIAEVEAVYIDEIVIEKIESLSDSESLKNSEIQDKKVADPDSENIHAGKSKISRTVRVDIERLDNLMNLVTELITIKNGLNTYESKNQYFTEQIEYLETITSNLHDAVMKVRMVPIERVFNRFPRLIRDLSRTLDKKMELHITGTATELDRTVIDEIGEPLVHLLRNAGDHGLESITERLAAGKNETGNIYLTAYQDGNNVVIEVGEDGRGIDIQKIKHKAIESGKISAEESAAMTDKDLIDLLFEPSFSTSEKISAVSGRGVGLDVVKTKIEELGGNVDVITKVGEGSKFIIRLPLSLAIIQALLVTVSGEKYVIPINSIQNIEEIDVKLVKKVQNQEVINLRNRVIPIIHLDKVLETTLSCIDKETYTVVIVNKGERQAGLIIDELIGQSEIVIKTLGKHLSNTHSVAGATILGDGSVALILDINSLV